MIGATGVRIGWSDLPPHVRAAIGQLLGSTVEKATSQSVGFSPGSADRVVTSTGRRAFVKAVSTAQNAETPALHRREARVTAALPPEVPAPRLLGVYDDGTWVALILEDIEGRLLLVNVQLFGGHDTTALLRGCASRFGADVTDLVAVLAGLASYFTHRSRLPPPPGLPTVRAFQRAQGDALLSWLPDVV